VNSTILLLDVVGHWLRVGFLAAAAAVAIVCVTDWMVRTRRLSPFGSVARFFRQHVDPLLAPIEQRVVRAGGLPSNAPWWLLGGIVVIGIVAIMGLGFVRNQLAGAMFATQMGARGIYVLLLGWVFGLLQLALIVRVLSSWIRVSPYSPWLRWAFVLTEPILRPLRRIVPTIGMIDITPIVAWFLLALLESLLRGLA
jgi:YggT family protein